MKKFSKLTLMDSSEFMSEDEMKKILGGSDSGNTSEYSSSDCPSGLQKCMCTVTFKDGKSVSGPFCARETNDAVKKLKQMYISLNEYDNVNLISCSIGPYK